MLLNTGGLETFPYLSLVKRNNLFDLATNVSKCATCSIPAWVFGTSDAGESGAHRLMIKGDVCRSTKEETATSELKEVVKMLG